MPAHSPEDTHAALEAAFNAADLDAFVATFADDAVMVSPPGGEHVRGPAAIRQAMAPLFALGPRAAIEVVGRVGGADGEPLALTHARWRLTATDAAGDPVEMAGRGTIVSRRQPDGTWLIVLDDPMSPG